ncbi:hypothetical protein [Amaricoccus sp.]|uniref:hypothetical protein n=1 Tax=Amaricoccus sp. TaxID=1872485 RepID=UPI001B6CC8FC|nr:hypothetical protein [Amaricoccus sp.]MBP7001716.1 hypothetical protein [Amaricoccus sp.]
MAYHIGKNGAVKIGANTVAAVQSWSLDIQTETVKGWGMGEAWTTSETLMQSWSGNVECYLDPEDEGQAALIPGAIVAIEFYPHSTAEGATYYSGNAIISGRPISAPKGDFVTITFNFEGQGALATDTVETP